MEESTVIEFSATLMDASNGLWGSHFHVPEAIARVFIQEKDRRVVCTLNGKVKYQCGILPYSDGTFVITVNKKTRDTMRLKEGSILQVALEKDTSEYGLPMPEEMAAVLEQDEAGNRLFHELTPGKIRTLLYIVAQVKNSDKRIFRAIQIIEHIKDRNGAVDYKQLGIDLKDKSKEM